MATKKKLLQAAAGTAAAGGGGLNVEEVFSTYLHTGTGATKSITNGIDLSGEGGLVWVKGRDQARENVLADTERGTGVWMSSNLTNGNLSNAQMINQFNSDGFRVGTESDVNFSGEAYASWTFRKAPKFFDVVTYTGNGTSGRTVSHNLGTTVGCIIVKRTSSAQNWAVYHRGNTSAPETDVLYLNSTDATTDLGSVWNDTAPTSTEFTLGDQIGVNANGETYVAYLFAHNDDDGEFGPDGDADIIKCGSYTTDANEDATIDLGFEPQWVLAKRTDSSTGGTWMLFDNMRGMQGDFLSQAALLEANDTNAESNVNRIAVTPTGFKVDNYGANRDYIYIAIRRGPMAVPTDATDVFDIDTRTGSLPSYVSTFPVDMALRKLQSISANWTIGSRLTGTKQLETSSTVAEGTDTDWAWDYMEGYGDDPNVAYALYSWMWKRAPNFFDTVCYTGNGTAGRTVSHNLGVAPEMMWVKQRNTSRNWAVYHSGTGNTKHLELNTSDSAATDTHWNNTTPTSTEFTVGTNSRVNESAGTYIAYLFASLDGVSKVGSFTHTAGTDTVVDCGFSGGARFVIIKRYSASGQWNVFDTERGLVAGNDAWLNINTTDAENTTYDFIDPSSSGFTVDGAGILSSASYIFYAVSA